MIDISYLKTNKTCTERIDKDLSLCLNLSDINVSPEVILDNSVKSQTSKIIADIFLLKAENLKTLNSESHIILENTSNNIKSDAILTVESNKKSLFDLKNLSYEEISVYNKILKIQTKLKSYNSKLVSDNSKYNNNFVKSLCKLTNEDILNYLNEDFIDSQILFKLNNKLQNYKIIYESIVDIEKLRKPIEKIRIIMDNNLHEYVNKSLKIIKRLSPLFKNNQYKKIVYKAKEEAFSKILKDNDNSKNNIVLDIDETIIGSEIIKDININNTEYLNKFDFTVYDGKLGIYVRPYVKELIKFCVKHFNIYIYSAGKYSYVNEIIEKLNIKEFISGIFSRELCIKIDTLYIKDLSIIPNYNTLNTIILDNSIYSFSNNLGEGVLISNYYYSKNDIELLYAIQYLQELLEVAKIEKKSIIEINKRNFVYEELLNFV